MKISIEHGTKKREIEGAFNICGSAHDLRAIANQIIAKCNESDMSYGWVEITPVALPQNSLPNTPPEPWE